LYRIYDTSRYTRVVDAHGDCIIRTYVDQGYCSIQFWTASSPAIDAYGKWIGDNGVDIPPDSNLAAKWCQLAADQGHAEAMFQLGCDEFDIFQRMPKRNYVLAEKWY